MNTTLQKQHPSTDPNERIDLMEKKVLLSALWMFVLMNFIFRDLHEIVKAEFLTDALSGNYNGRQVTEAMFLLGGIIVEIPIAMMLMTLTLPARANRRANLAVAPLFGLTFIGVPGDLDDYFHIGLILIALAAIAWQAWKWEQPTPYTQKDTNMTSSPKPSSPSESV